MIRLEKGFTFVELMIVVVIVGILAGVTVPLGALWISQARISGVEGEIAVAVGKAKGSATEISSVWWLITLLQRYV